MGVIGSSATVLFDSGGCTSDCDVAGESCRLPRINKQIAAGQRQRWASRAIPRSPSAVSRGEAFLRGMLGNF